jgi:hypothetical protein
MEGLTGNYLRVNAFAPSPRWNEIDAVQMIDVHDGVMKGVVSRMG